MAITDSLDAATQAVNALLAKINVSTARTIVVQDIGTADNYTFTPAPAVSAYGSDLLIVADITAPNTTTTPHLNVSGLGSLGIFAADGSAVKVGSVSGKALFGLSSATGGGYTARLLFSQPVVSSFAGSLTDSNVWHVGTATGSANTITTTWQTAAPVAGGSLYYSSIQHSTTNTGAATLNGAPIIVSKTGAALTGGEIPTTGRAEYFFDGSSQRLLNPESAPLQNFRTQTGGTYSPSPGARRVKVKITAGGGAGGSCYGNTTEGGVATSYAAGGGAGETRVAIFAVNGAAAINAANPVTFAIGAGGAGNTSASNGGNGSDSTFGTLMTAKGGTGGQSQSYDADAGVGGTGGFGGFGVTGGDGAKPGGGSANGGYVGACSGIGGASAYGGGSIGQNNGPGRAAGAPGSGGGGACVQAVTGNYPGGNGASGCIEIEELP